MSKNTSKEIHVFKSSQEELSFFDRCVATLASKYFKEKNPHFSLQRKSKMVVYANDWIGSNIYLYGQYEKVELQLLSDLLDVCGIDAENAVIVDAGSNIGNHAIHFAAKYSHVYAIEANPHTFKLLEINMEPYENVTLINSGLGKVDGQMTLSESVGNAGSSSAVYDSNGIDETTNGDRVGSVVVKVSTMDSLVRCDRKIDLVKIDVEGMEFDVLEGAVETLKRDMPIIAFEQHAEDFFQEGFNTPATSFLKKLGYTFGWIEGSNPTSLSWLPSKVNTLVNLFFGKSRKLNLIFGDKVPVQFHSMLIAIPSDLKSSIGL